MTCLLCDRFFSKYPCLLQPEFYTLSLSNDAGQTQVRPWFNAVENFLVCLLYLALFVMLGHLDLYDPGDVIDKNLVAESSVRLMVNSVEHSLCFI